MVADLVNPVRIDDFPECSGPHRARRYRLWQSGRENHRPTSWGACSLRISLAYRTVGAYRDPAALLIRRGLSLRAELKRSALAMEHPWRSRCSHIMGSVYIAASDVPGVLRLLTGLWKIKFRGHASVMALRHRSGYLYRR